MDGSLSKKAAEKLLAESHTAEWMKNILERITTDFTSVYPPRDVSMNDVASAFICAMLREKEFYRSEFAIGF